MAVLALVSALLLMGCTPQQEINVTVNRYLWCNRPVGVDFFLGLTQDGTDTATGVEFLSWNSDEPAAWSHVFDFSDQGDRVPHVGTRVRLRLNASTNETVQENNDFVNLERPVDIS